MRSNTLQNKMPSSPVTWYSVYKIPSWYCDMNILGVETSPHFTDDPLNKYVDDWIFPQNSKYILYEDLMFITCWFICCLVIFFLMQLAELLVASRLIFWVRVQSPIKVLMLCHLNFIYSPAVTQRISNLTFKLWLTHATVYDYRCLLAKSKKIMTRFQL